MTATVFLLEMIVKVILLEMIVKIILLVMIVELSDFRCDFSNLPPLEAVSRIEDGPMLLLKLPQLRVDVERPAEVSLK
jgi:hypothetical protein